MPVTVVNQHGLHRRPGSDQPDLVYIGRPRSGRPLGLGNPLRLGVDGDRSEVLIKYRAYLRKEWVRPGSLVREQIEALAQRAAAGEHLTLVCWCKPLACHGDVIKEAVDNLVARIHAKAVATPEEASPSSKPKL